ncbi:17237_t:CDS:1, partial [Racocetra fulgida]
EKYESANVTAEEENLETECFSLGRKECNGLNPHNNDHPGCNGSDNDYMQETTIDHNLDKLGRKL